MSNKTDLTEHRRNSLKHQLQELYIDLARQIEPITKSHAKLTENQIEARAQVFRQMQGKFVVLHRAKTNLTPEQVAQQMEWNLDQYLAFENGEKSALDSEFFKICSIVGANQEISVFLEKIEEAFNPKLFEARKLSAEALKELGVTFADPSKYDTSPRGKLINFRKTKSKSLKD